jgi:hypothetical protein
MWKAEQHEYEDYKKTMYSRKLREYVETRLESIKEQLISAKDYKEVLILQTEYNTYKDLYVKVK